MKDSKLLQHAVKIDMPHEEYENEITELYASLMVVSLNRIDQDQGEAVQIRKSFEFDDFTLHVTAYRIYKEDKDIPHPIDKMYQDREDPDK